MPTYIADRYAKLLQNNQLDTFDKVWDYKVDWFEAPNERRGGWSGVGKLDLVSDNGERRSVFIKKQQNHGRLTFCHPFKGEPTFRREYQRLQFLKAQDIAAPAVVFYGEKQAADDMRAILITEALEGYEPLDVVAERWQHEANVKRMQRRNLLTTVAGALRRFHEVGLVHRALYPKHVFVRDVETKPVAALIDLEKARFGILFWYRAYFDLAALNRHAKHWRRSERLYFFIQYLQQSRLTPPSKLLCRLIIGRALRR